MKRGEYTFVWQAPDWPGFRWDLAALTAPLSDVSRAQGLLLGRLADVGLSIRDQASLAALTEDVVRTSEIEGERLEPASVRSSIARRLGVDIGALAPADRKVEGVVDVVLDATQHFQAPVTRKRLLGWHASLFPTGWSGMTRLRVGAWRNDASGPMQVVSGPAGRQRVHFEAPPAHRLPAEMRRYLRWLNADDPQPFLKAGLAHLWFVTLHPFDDGNGRLARALGDYWLARADGSPQRFYSLSAQVQRERRDYYAMLERTQRGGLDVTPWLQWFLGSLQRAIGQAHAALDGVLSRARFWQRLGGLALNPRQVKVLGRLHTGFEGKLTSSKWAALARCSPDTALRDLQELVELGVLRRSVAGGRSTSYELPT